MSQREDAVKTEARRMTREQVLRKALEGRITWEQAGVICRLTPRHLRRVRLQYEKLGYVAKDGRQGRAMPRRLDAATVSKIIELRKGRYEDWSIKHFHERLRERHKVEISYTWTRIVLVNAGLHEPSDGRGTYRRKRERRPMVGMMIHCDGSTHEWLAGLPKQDLVMMLDDADSKLLFARFFEQEGTMSTMSALEAVVQKHGRFAEFYVDHGSHYKPVNATAEPDSGQVMRVLKTLGIRLIQAHSPQARGRCERFFQTVQGRWPQEFQDANVRNYAQANALIDRKLLTDFNRRFTVEPAQAESAFVPMVGLDLALLFSIQHERVVQNDNTVRFEGMILQLPTGTERFSYARCPVIVHQRTNATLAISYQQKLLARYGSDGQPLLKTPTKTKALA